MWFLALVFLLASPAYAFTPAQEATLALLADRCALSTPTEIRCDGVNLRITDGSGKTNLDPGEVGTGLGNIHLGYSETLGRTLARTGIHGLSTGRGNDWVGYAWLNVGRECDCLGPYCVVFGLTNVAYDYGSVLGGTNNIAGTPNPELTNAYYSTVVGGIDNWALAYGATALGGWSNRATGANSTVGAGALNLASGDFSWVAGGDSNIASGYASCVEGGRLNRATGYWSAVGGGATRTQPNVFGWSAGSTGPQVSGRFVSP